MVNKRLGYKESGRKEDTSLCLSGTNVNHHSGEFGGEFVAISKEGIPIDHKGRTNPTRTLNPPLTRKLTSERTVLAVLLRHPNSALRRRNAIEAGS